MALKKSQIRNPMLTRNGRPNLGPLNVKQLQALLDKESRPKTKAKIANRIRILTSRKGYVAPAVEVKEEAAE